MFPERISCRISEAGLQCFARPRETARQCSDRNLQHVGSLLVRKSFDQDERHGQPLFVGQTGHRGLHGQQSLLRVPGSIADLEAGLFRGEEAAATPARTHFVDPRIAHDAEHPALELRFGPPLLVTQQCPLDGDLHDIVRIVHIPRQRPRKTPQPGQQLDDLLPDLRDASSLVTHICIRCRPPFSSHDERECFHGLQRIV
jgi:hypothetical protein